MSAGKVVLRFSGQTWRFRLGAFVRGLKRPRMVGVLVFVALLPVALDQIISVAVAGSEMVGAVVLGLMIVVGIVVVGGLVAVLRKAPASSITFDEDGIVEVIGGRRFERGWSWVQSVVDEPEMLVLFCEGPARSFRLSKSGGARQLVVMRGTGQHAPLRDLCCARGLCRS